MPRFTTCWPLTAPKLSCLNESLVFSFFYSEHVWNASTDSPPQISPERTAASTSRYPTIQPSSPQNSPCSSNNLRRLQ